MNIYEEKQSREEYFDIQIKRSQQKFDYCKVSAKDALKYLRIIRRQLVIEDESGIKIACMGTRNGREVDLFRLAMKYPKICQSLKLSEWHRHGCHSILDKVLLPLGRNDIKNFDKGGVFGVEINPMAKRKDIYIGSFDDLPPDWGDSVDVLYSNSFDQSQDPYKTASEWNRIVKPGGLFIIAVADGQQVSGHDPVGDITLEDIGKLFPGKLVYYNYRDSWNGYSEAIIRK